MKHTITIFSICAAALVSLTSCEKFFDREPLDQFAAEQFFSTKTDLEYYANGLIDTALPDFDDVALGEDRYTDLCGTKESKNFFWPDRYTASIASGWSYSNWSFLRQVAYMLDNMKNAKSNVSPEVYNHYEGVARYFRALSTFNKVKKFGDVYWIDHVVSPSDSTILYGPRQDREFIVHNIVEDLKFAAENCLASGAGIRTDGCIYVNKYTAEALASRICLYEGTYRKYHSTNPSTGRPWTGEYESAEDLLKLAMDFAGDLMESGVFKLHSNYRELFTSTKLPSDEVIWGRTCNEELGVAHKVTYKYCSTTSSLLYGPTKDYVMMFLDKSGKPLPSAEISVTKEFENRDNRLAATVLAPGQKMINAQGKEVDFAPDFTWTTTGYIWIKWVIPEYSPMNEGGTDKSLNSVPVLRYAEVLLNYAEAAEELGMMDKTVWDKTIGELRKVHGGLTSAPYPGEAGYTADPILRAYFTEDLLHSVELSDVALEIRRERVVEMMFEEGRHYDDLMRWNIGDIIERRYKHQGWKGIYLSKEEAASGFDFNGKHYTVSTTSPTGQTNIKVTTAADKNHTLSNGTYGYLIYNYQLQWDDKMYLYPIPVTAKNVNPQLGQNEGWQWL